MSHARLAAVLAVASFAGLTACVTPPPKSDPFAELRIKEGPVSSAPKTYPETDLAVIFSQNSAATKKYLKDFAGSAMSLFRHNYFPRAKFDAEQLFARFPKLLERHFRSVTVVDDLSKAPEARLAAMVDVTAAIAPPPSSSITTFEAKLIFVTPEKTQVAVLSAVETGDVNAGNRTSTMIPETSAAVLASIDRDLSGSPELARFDRPAGPAAAGAAAAPAPPAPVRSDIDDVPRVSASPRKAHAVVIGVEKYRQQLPTADFAAGDARLVSKYLTAVLGYPAENVATLTEGGATKSDFEKHFERWLPNRVQPGDEVFVFYSGHGSPNPRTGDAYLVPYDGDPTYLEQTGYPLDKLYAQLSKLPARSVTVVLDSCFSGAGGRSVLAKGAKPLVTVAASAPVPANISLLSASAADQISSAYAEKGHGLFTYFLLKGMAQQAAKGPVRMREAFDFAAPQVSRVARQDYNNEQVPQWRGAP